jgi:hypothetical protein
MSRSEPQRKIVSIEVDFEVIAEFENGGIVLRHSEVDVFADDYSGIEEVALDKAKIGCKVHMLPSLLENDPL